MRHDKFISLIIPALNKEASIAAVLDAVPPWVDEKIVVDNGSTDNTDQVARNHGARTLHEPQAGYGAACLAGITASEHADMIVFLDADLSDDPSVMETLVDPISSGDADMTISDRTATPEGRRVMAFVQIYGNGLACLLMKIFWGYRYHDLGPFRAISRLSLMRLDMSDRDYGWTVEMQIRALKQKLNISQVGVPYRKRLAGRSKISGTVSGVLRAGSIILYVFFRALLHRKGV